MNIKQFRYTSDNLGYLIYGNRSAIAIDGGAAKEILEFVNSNNLTLIYIVNTHSHMDHTLGDATLLKGSDATYLDNRKLITDGAVEIEGEMIKRLYQYSKEKACPTVLNVNFQILKA